MLSLSMLTLFCKCCVLGSAMLPIRGVVSVRLHGAYGNKTGWLPWGSFSMNTNDLILGGREWDVMLFFGILVLACLFVNSGDVWRCL